MNKLRIVKILVLQLLMILGLISCDKPVELQESMSLKEKIDLVFQQNVIFGKPVGCIIGIIQNGEEQIFSYGDAGLGFGAPKQNTIFEFNSITKTFTGILLNDLVGDSIVNLNDPISKYLPDNINLPTYNGQEILLWHLVTHTSGLPRSNDDFGASASEQVFTNEDYYSFLEDISAQAFPFNNFTVGNELNSLGTNFNYSNIGMALLGHILELASGQTYEELFNNRISNILNMADTKTYPELSLEQKARIAKAYTNELYEVSIQKNWGRSIGAGAYLITINDLLVYLQRNIQADLSEESYIKNSHKPLFYFNDDRAMGSSWGIEINDADTIISHDGAGMHESYIKFNKSKKYGVVALSNTRTDGYFFKLLNQIFEMLE